MIEADFIEKARETYPQGRPTSFGLGPEHCANLLFPAAVGGSRALPARSQDGDALRRVGYDAHAGAEAAMTRWEKVTGDG